MKLKVYFPAYEGVLSSEKWSRLFYNLADNRNGVIPIQVNIITLGSSFQVTAGSGLKVNVAEGYAFVGGHLVYESGGILLDVPPSSTSYIYVEVQKDTNNRTIGASYLVSSNGSLESQNRMLLATVVTSSNAVTSITDERRHISSNLMVPFTVSTNTSTTLDYSGAKAVYLNVRALGAGGSGACTNTNGTYAYGGVGGGFLQDDDLFLGSIQIEIQIGAGGASVSGNSNGNNGGNTVITVKSGGTVLKTYVAPFGRGGLRSTSNTEFLTHQFNYEGVYYNYNLSIPSATLQKVWMPSSPNIISPFSMLILLVSSYQNYQRIYFGGGSGGSLFRDNNGNITTYTAQPSALVFGSSGGSASSGTGSNGISPAGGGGAGQTSSGAGANGFVFLRGFVVY